MPPETQKDMTVEAGLQSLVGDTVHNDPLSQVPGCTVHIPVSAWRSLGAIPQELGVLEASIEGKLADAVSAITSAAPTSRVGQSATAVLGYAPTALGPRILAPPASGPAADLPCIVRRLLPPGSHFTSLHIYGNSNTDTQLPGTSMGPCFVIGPHLSGPDAYRAEGWPVDFGGRIVVCNLRALGRGSHLPASHWRVVASVHSDYSTQGVSVADHLRCIGFSPPCDASGHPEGSPQPSDGPGYPAKSAHASADVDAGAATIATDPFGGGEGAQISAEPGSVRNFSAFESLVVEHRRKWQPESLQTYMELDEDDFREHREKKRKSSDWIDAQWQAAVDNPRAHVERNGITYAYVPEVRWF